MKKEHIVNAIFIFLHALSYKITKRRVPLMVSLGVTDRCNLNCPFCYAKDKKIGRNEYTTDQLLDYIDQFIKLGTRIFLLQGGEPFLRDDLKDIISYIKSRGRYCRISTNGMFAANKIDSLTGVDQISFSLDGNEEVVDMIRGKGVYKMVVAGMEEAYARKIPFEIHASLIRESALNRSSVLHLLKLARSFKTYVSFCVTCVTGAEHTKAVGSGDLTSVEIKEFYEFLRELKKKGYPVSNTYNSLKKTLNWPIEYSQIGFPHNMPHGFKFAGCRHGRLICWLDANNILWPCPITFYRSEFAVPVQNSNIKEAWNKLGEKVRCVACGGSDESTTFFALGFEDLARAFLKIARKG